MLSHYKWLTTLLLTILVTVNALPELSIEHDERKIFEVAEFGFLPGGKLTLSLTDLNWDNKTAVGKAAFYIRKGWILDEQYDLTDEDYAQPIQYEECFLDNTFVKDEIKDGSSVVATLPDHLDDDKSWEQVVDVLPGQEGLWQVLFVSCKESTVSFKLSITEVNPGGNYLSAGDIPLPFVYAVSSFAYMIAAAYWASLLIFKKDTRVFRAHWLMFVLVLCIVINKGLQSMKYHYMRIGILSEGWKIGFYIFAGIKGILSLLIIVLLASGWMFIKPFLNSKDKRVISIIIPLQVLANVASAISNETAIGSIDWTFWNMLLPVVDLMSCGIILWTILQTRKHLASGANADGKEQDILNKYKLWSSFYLVTLLYVYVTRIVVQLLHAALPFQMVSWFGEAVNEIATFCFYIFIGYKFRPYHNNPYIQVAEDDDEEEVDLRLNSINMHPISNRGE